MQLFCSQYLLMVKATLTYYFESDKFQNHGQGALLLLGLVGLIEPKIITDLLSYAYVRNTPSK